MATKLAPCPHCGEARRLAIVVVDRDLCAVECGECLARGPLHGSRSAAAEGWNLRREELTEY